MVISVNKIDNLISMINECNNIVVFTGAGVSTESGIPDFRSKDGLYNMKYSYPPEEILSHSFFVNNPEEFYRFYRDKLNVLDKEPNIIHNTLKRMEDMGKVRGIITQNIDGLHEKSGSRNVVTFHGSVYSNHCIKCSKFYPAEEVFNSTGICKCECTGIIKPDVVLYEEEIPSDVLRNSTEMIAKCDMLLVLGTSLTVYPASGLINYFRGKYLVIVNRDTTSYDNRADLVINMGLKEVFEMIDNYFKV